MAGDKAAPAQQKNMMPFPVTDKGKDVKLAEMYAGMLDWQIYRAGQTPGPGQYQLPNPSEQKGGRFSNVTPKGYCDDDIKRALTIPGPADYPAPKLPTTSGGRFSTAKPKSELDWIALRGAEMPGPADIDVPRNPLPGGGRFSKGNPKSDVEWLMYHAAQMPGPADYDVKINPPPSGGRFGNSKPKTELDWIVLRAKDTPGPGQYKQADMKFGGGKFNLSKAKTELDWVVYRSAQVPGPGQYDAAKSMDAMFRTPACRMLGRTGPKTLPFPYGGAKQAPRDLSDTQASRHRSGTHGMSMSRRSMGSSLSSSMGRPKRPSSQVGSHPLAEDPSAPLHRRKRKLKLTSGRSRSAMDYSSTEGSYQY